MPVIMNTIFGHAINESEIMATIKDGNDITINISEEDMHRQHVWVINKPLTLFKKWTIIRGKWVVCNVFDKSVINMTNGHTGKHTVYRSEEAAVQAHKEWELTQLLEK